MPKVKYNLNNWAIKKHCPYCGQTFYPVAKEDFCGHDCEREHKEYGDWLMDLEMERLYKEEEKENFYG